MVIDNFTNIVTKVESYGIVGWSEFWALPICGWLSWDLRV